MNILIVGGGGREHALAWKVQQSPLCTSLFVAPGNAGTPGTAVAIDATNVDALVDFAASEQIDLVIIGPESALELGLADALGAKGIRAFGPSQAAAMIETSKVFGRHVAATLGLPSPIFATFTDTGSALAWARSFGRPIVVKQSALAAGKGVVVPADAAAAERAIIDLLAPGGEIVLEERLDGPECSLLVMTDGITARPLPLVQDHKRIGVGDTGPNTGGMGAFAPAVVPYGADELTRTFVQPVIDHFRAKGTPYVGVLYAGLMLTATGPKLIEFNCRFGDPEAQAIMPLLDSDLVELTMACCDGTLDDQSVDISAGAACAVVVAAPGYPAAPTVGSEILFPATASDDAIVFHAGTVADAAGTIRTAGGRVLCVTGRGADLGRARAAAYRTISQISFDGMHVRGDIGWRSIGAGLATYAAAGVNIEEGNRAVSMLKASVERTHTPSVLGGIGAFGGAIDVSSLKQFDCPVLVASTDGVGTKVELAARAGRPEVSGIDIVNHCIDDVLVQNARPLFFLDYIAAASLDATLVAAVVGGMATACEAAGCVLLGGETAEMPGVYEPGAFDVAGTLVGVAERGELLPTATVAVGDVLIGLASSGPHTNGYSLLRKLFAWLPLDAQPAPLDRPLVDALLEPHRSYLAALDAALRSGRVKALAHITGGGLIENVPRVLPPGTSAQIRLGSWPVPPLFRLVTELTPNMTVAERHRSLNMGIGMVVVAAPADVAAIQAMIPEPSWIIGALIAGDKHVELLPEHAQPS
jgi:phosphoribosylamine--glycine ligase/phosphoribosylaminoimidazole synthetase